MKTFTPAELNEMKVVDLRSLASQLDIPGRSGATRKADLINLILDHQGLDSDIEEELSPVISGDDESEQTLTPNGSDRVRTARPCTEERIQVSLWLFYPPRSITNLPRTYRSGWGTTTLAFWQNLVTTAMRLPRPPP